MALSTLTKTKGSCSDLLLNPINTSVQDSMAEGCVLLLGTACSYLKFKTYIQTPDSTKS